MTTVGKVLVKISNMKESNMSIIFNTCKEKLIKAQKRIVNELNKIVQHQENDIEDDNMSEMSHSLAIKCQLSQTSQLAEEAIKTLTQEELKKLDTVLQETQTDLVN